VSRLSLRARLIIAFVGIAVLAPILATLLSGFGVHRSVDDYLERRAQDAVLTSADLAESAYTRGDDGPGWEAGTLENLGRELDLTGFDYRLVEGHERLLDTTPMGAEGSPVASTDVHDPDGNVVGTLELYAIDTPRTAADDALRGELDQAHVLGVAIAALIAVIAAILVAGRMSSPLRRLAAAARGISEGGSVPEPLPRGSPEVRDLEASLVGLAVDLERQQRARRQLAQDLSHELRTPLMLLQGRIEAMQDGVIPFDADGLAALHTETLRLSRLIGQIERLTEAEAKAAELQVEDFDLDDLAREAHDALAAAFEMRNLGLELDARPAPARGDRDAVRQIVLNLLSNALKYAPEGAPVRLSTATESGAAVLRVRDEGRLGGGERRRVFERFYRGREARDGGSGAGLGLTIARELAKAQGGSIELEPTSPATSFVLRLPAPDPAGRAADPRVGGEPPSREDPVASHPPKG
jgi:two-component system sensor histidine kinase BaeS